MDWVKFFQDEGAKVIAAFIVMILTAVITFFKKVPKFIGVRRTFLDNVVIVDKGSEVNNIVRYLAK
jgi:hypothetical protein